MIHLYQPCSQGLSSLPTLVVGTETVVAADHVTAQTLGGRQICWKGGGNRVFFCHSDKFTEVNVLEYPPTLRFWMDRWSRDQPQPGSLFQRLREAEKRAPGNEVAPLLANRIENSLINIVSTYLRLFNRKTIFTYVLFIYLFFLAQLMRYMQ